MDITYHVVNTLTETTYIVVERETERR